MFLLGAGAVRTYIIVMEGAATLLLLGLAGWLATAARRGPGGAFRVASAGASAACLLFGATSLQHLLHLATRDDLVSAGWDDMLLGPLAAMRITVVVVTTLAVVLGLRHWANHRQGSVDGRSDDRSIALVRLSARGRTLARELEVLDVIRQGVLSDHDIGEALHISRATAATHVQNILRKTGLHDRRNLMLLPPARSTRHGKRSAVGIPAP